MSEGRERLARIFGRLGSDSPGERAAALVAIDRAMPAADFTWTLVRDLVALGTLGSDAVTSRSDRLLGDLVGGELERSRPDGWALEAGEAAVLLQLRGVLDGDRAQLKTMAGLDLVDRALAICRSLRKRTARSK
jgi:hypothetical protein